MIHDFPARNHFDDLSIDLDDINNYHFTMERIQFIRQKARRRIMAPSIVSTIATALAMFYALVYIAALITTFAVGIVDPIGTATMFGLQGLETQLPLLLFLGAAWFICVLGDSLKIAIGGRIPNFLISPGTTDLYRLILRIAYRLHGLVGAKRINVIDFEAPNLLLALRPSSPLPLAGGWSPGVHPSLEYE